MIKAVAKSGAVCSINMVAGSMDLTNPDILSTDVLFRHIDYMANLAGIDHVGFGSDHIPNTNFTSSALVDKVLENGYSESDCNKFPGGNMYGVFSQVWT